MKLAPLKLGFFFSPIRLWLILSLSSRRFPSCWALWTWGPRDVSTAGYIDLTWFTVMFLRERHNGGWPSSPCFLGLLNTSVLNGFESNTHLSTCFFPLKTVEILDLFVGFEKRLVIVKTQSFNNMPCKLTLLFVLFRQSSPHFSVPWIKPNFWGLEGKHPHWEAIRQGGPLPRAIQHPGKATILRYYTYI